MAKVTREYWLAQWEVHSTGTMPTQPQQFQRIIDIAMNVADDVSFFGRSQTELQNLHDLYNTMFNLKLQPKCMYMATGPIESSPARFIAYLNDFGLP